ncbi:MAG: DUF2225 domain-containing protein, partial [Lysobacter sp.]|nr:DUF2225 domain-containing protein [Lysobacter sp.]
MQKARGAALAYTMSWNFDEECYMTMLMRSMLALALLYPAFSHATTWGETKVQDPIDRKAKCDVQEPMSSGSYIYQWPEKYDQVFWPMTDQNGIWFCKKSGFVAFIGDFEGLTDAEKARISQYLRENYKGGKDEGSLEAKLKSLEALYALREKDEAFRNMLLRALARWYQDSGDTEKANEYRRKALEGIRSALTGEMPEDQKLQYLYVAANYTRELGDAEASDRYLVELRDK